MEEWVMLRAGGEKVVRAENGGGDGGAWRVSGRSESVVLKSRVVVMDRARGGWDGGELV